MHVRKMRGFSLLEMMITLSILMIACGITFMSLMPALKQARVTNAYNTTLMTMRQAREAAIAERRTYMVTFSNAVTPNTITITQASTGVVTTVQQLPNDVFFTAVAGIPTAAASTPDHFGTGGVAIDFAQNIPAGAKNVIYFYPDGSAQDVNNNMNSGVIYVARTGEILSSRAVTLWGTTGRLRGWRLYNVSGVNTWKQQ